MKKFTSLLIALMLSLAVFAAEETEQTLLPSFDFEKTFNALDTAARQDYLMRQLSIETEEHTFSSGGEYANYRAGRYNAYGYGYWTSSSSKSTVWYPYEGGYRIDRSTFYNIVGKPELALEYEDWKKAVKQHDLVMNTVGGVLLGVGSGLLLGGFIDCLVGVSSDNYTTSRATLDYVLMGVGGALVTAGTIPFLVFDVTSPKMPNVSIAFAIGLANEYNRTLLTSY